MSAPPHNSSAFMLVELMFVLGLLAVVGLVATEIFLLNIRTSTKLAEQHRVQAQFDQAVAQLRRDVWSASSLTLEGSQSLTIGLADGRTITWDAGKSLDRRLKPDVRQWDAMKTDIAFEVRGPTVALVLQPTQSEPGGKLVLVSQSILLHGGAQ